MDAHITQWVHQWTAIFQVQNRHTNTHPPHIHTPMFVRYFRNESAIYPRYPGQNLTGQNPTVRNISGHNPTVQNTTGVNATN